MIATTLAGGLGNQMFMYAMVRALSIRNSTTMAFNLKLGFEKDLFNRRLEINNFHTELPESPLYTFDYKLGRAFRKISRKLKRNIIIPNMVYQCEKQNAFEDFYIKQKIKNAYIEGYWLSEKYFKDCEQQIRKDFSFKCTFTDEIEAEFKKIRDYENPVMIGIRRYQETSGKDRDSRLVPISYYLEAIKIIKSRITNPVFIVFTQDAEWAMSELPPNEKYYFVKPKTSELSSLEDLYLMNSCKHFIISNSTYYWWGAWLKDSCDKIVIAPDKFPNRDTICDSWIKI